ncbi:hypothetical protein GQ600_8697 [Phytophthora cactorum]|nr:hypothetical protein GQ600_8697 [Phytophthora cactorum]
MPLETPILHRNRGLGGNPYISNNRIRKSIGTWRTHTPRAPEGEVTLSFEEAYASDGYDEEAQELIKGLCPTSQKRSSPQSANESSPQSVTLLDSQDTNHAVSEEFVPEPWPEEVTLLTNQWNPPKWRVSKVGVGSRDGAGCGCEYRCNAVFCLNAKERQFCCDRNCLFGGRCGNSLKESLSLTIARSSRMGKRVYVASSFIPAGVIVGQHLGHLQFFEYWTSQCWILKDTQYWE